MHGPCNPDASLFYRAVTEWGDDVLPISEEEAMVIVNHQSTGDVCTLMMCLQDKGTVRRERLKCCDGVCVTVVECSQSFCLFTQHIVYENNVQITGKSVVLSVAHSLFW